MSMKSSHQMGLELLEQTLHSASRFQMQAAKHRVLVIRDALTADKDVCEALLHKIDHLLGQETVPAANPCTLTMVALTAGTERLLGTAI
jgi:CII-binding regulator of phage lambda lysogenization HflD